MLLLGLFTELVSGSVSGKMSVGKDIEDARDREYYQDIKDADKFIPYRKMFEREEERLETHLVAMNSLEEGSAEWGWRKELARRAHERSIKWNRLDRSQS